MARSPPPEAARPAYPAQNETSCRPAQLRISGLAIGPRLARERMAVGVVRGEDMWGPVGSDARGNTQIVQNLPGSRILACGRKAMQ